MPVLTWLKIGAAVGLLAALIGSGAGIYKHIYNKGYEAAERKHDYELAKARKKAEDAATMLEAQKSERRIVYETVTKEINKIVERPIYLSDCVDDDGLYAINQAIAGKLTLKPSTTLSTVDSVGR